jgi:LacI family transcriptional regulator
MSSSNPTLTDARRRPTIKDVARQAEVSVGTVSAVINGSPQVSEKNRQRVLQCIAELQYEPNTAARSLKRQLSSSIGLIVPDLQNPFFTSVASGVQHFARQNDILMVLGTTGSEIQWEEYYAQSLRNRRLDGMILLSGSGKPTAGLIKLVESGSVVFVDECVPGLDAPFISATNRTGARQVANEVLQAGHRKVAIVTGPLWLWTSQQRLAGYREAFAGIGQDPDLVPIFVGDYTEESGHHTTKSILEDPRTVDISAIIYSNDLMAVGGAKWLRKAGKRIPEDVSIVGFDDILASSDLSPPLTTVAQPGYDMGRAASQLLLHKLGMTDAPAIILFETELKLRNSIATIHGLGK